MFKILVLCGIVTSALAGPISEDYEAIDGRGYRDCTEDCYDKYLNWSVYRPLCLMKCSAFNRKILGRSLEYTPAAFTNPMPFTTTEQPINQGMLMQITAILSEVIKKQQEMLQMISSCNCAQRPNQPISFAPAKEGNYF